MTEFELLYMVKRGPKIDIKYPQQAPKAINLPIGWNNLRGPYSFRPVVRFIAPPHRMKCTPNCDNRPQRSCKKRIHGNVLQCLTFYQCFLLYWPLETALAMTSPISSAVSKGFSTTSPPPSWRRSTSGSTPLTS